MQMLNQLSYEANRSISRVPQGSRINFRCFPLFSCYKNALSLFGKRLVAFSVYLVHLSVNFPVDFDSRCYREWLENWKHDCMPPSTSTCLKFDQKNRLPGIVSLDWSIFLGKLFDMDTCTNTTFFAPMFTCLRKLVNRCLWVGIHCNCCYNNHKTQGSLVKGDMIWGYGSDSVYINANLEPG